jgi:hypothetical protein
MPVPPKSRTSRLPVRKPRFFTVAEVGIILRMTAKEVEALISKKELMGIKSGTEGHTFRVRSEDLEIYIQRRSRIESE